MTPLFAYFGPETVLPATSIVATIFGVFLMLGKNSVRWCVASVKGVVAACLGRKAATPPAAPASAPVPAPHFAEAAESHAPTQAH